MSTEKSEAPVEWGWPCTLRDLLAVDALTAEVRASVERYIRTRGLPGDPKDDNYMRGWEDGVEEMRDAISSAYVPPPRAPRPAGRSR